MINQSKKECWSVWKFLLLWGMCVPEPSLAASVYLPMEPCLHWFQTAIYICEPVLKRKHIFVGRKWKD